MYVWFGVSFISEKFFKTHYSSREISPHTHTRKVYMYMYCISKETEKGEKDTNTEEVEKMEVSNGWEKNLRLKTRDREMEKTLR